MAHVIKEWFVNETPGSDGVYVRITGREGGVISFLLSLVGIDPTVSLIVDKDNVRFESGSWSGFVMYVTPLEKLCTGGYGYAKPWKTALLIAMLGTFTVYLAPIFWIGAIVYYFLNKQLMLALYDIGGRAYELDFKRSVIEGIKVDENEAARVIRIIESLVKRGSSLAPAPAPAVERPRGAVTTVQALHTANALPAGDRCPKCGAAVTGEHAFCDGCGFKLR
jgi:hypothetical protein